MRRRFRSLPPFVSLALVVAVAFTLATPPAALAQGGGARGLDAATLTADFYNDELLGSFAYSKPWSTPLDFAISCFGESPPFTGCKLDPGLADGASYSVRWHGDLIVPADGAYTFSLTADDGGRIFLDGVEFVDQGWRYPSPDLASPPRTLTLTAGRHSFILDYEQRPPFIASLVTSWQGPGFGPEPIPLAGAACDNVTVPPGTASGLGWSMGYQISPNDGMMLTGVQLGSRLMAERTSIPYLLLATSATPNTRYELRPDCSGTGYRSRLVDFSTTSGGDRLVLRAKYVLDNFSALPGSSLEVTQDYNFLPERPEGGCEPSGSIPFHVEEVFPCSSYRLTVHYKWNGAGGATLSSLNIPERVHFQVDGSAQNSSTLFLDRDGPLQIVAGPIERREDVGSEGTFNGLNRGQKGSFDNYHQTSKSTVQAPSGGPVDTRSILPAPGCPECAHMHWRWGQSIFITADEYGHGNPLIPRTDFHFDNFPPFTYNSDQDLDLAVARYHPGEEDPAAFSTLLNGEPVNHDDMVLWYSPNGHLAEDTFWAHWGFFSVGYVDLRVNATPSPNPVPGGNLLTFHVTVDNRGPGRATQVQVALAGFQSQAFPDSTSDPRCSNVQGIYTCAIGDVAAGSSQTFNVVLRVFGNVVGPSESMETIFATKAHQVDGEVSDNVTTVTTMIAPPIDLALTGAASPSPARAGQSLTYEFEVSELTPDLEATGALFTLPLPANATFVSAATSQGSCALSAGTVTCPLGTVEFLSPVDVEVVVRPIRRGAVVALPRVSFDGIDRSPANNRMTLATTVQP